MSGSCNLGGTSTPEWFLNFVVWSSPRLNPAFAELWQQASTSIRGWFDYPLRKSGDQGSSLEGMDNMNWENVK